MTDPTRVLLVTQVMASYRIPLCRKLAALPGIQFRVLHGTETNARAALLADPTARLPFDTVVVRNRLYALGTFTLGWQRGALRAARAFQPDVVILSGEVGTISSWVLSIWARITDRKVIAWTSAWEPQRVGSASFRVKRLAMRLYVRLPDMTLTYSTRARSELIALGAPPARVVVCHNGIEVSGLLERDSEIRTGATVLREAEGVGDRLVFVYVGRIAADKRLERLIDAFAGMATRERCVLWFVGDGPELAALKARAADRNLKTVRFWGRIVDDVESHFAAADCFVLPGPGGLALNQAMVVGVPCICSEADGTEDDLVIDGVTGVRFKAEDGTGLETAMERALQLRDSDELRRMGANARTHVLATSTVDRMIDTFSAGIGTVTRAGPRRRGLFKRRMRSRFSPGHRS